MLSKEARHKRVTYFYILEKAKIQGQESLQWFRGSREKELSALRYKATFLEDGNIQYLDCGSGYMSVTFQKTLVKKGEFYFL